MPQLPPQPSSPQFLPVQFGVQPPPSHTPPALQVWPPEHVPQLPPQPSSPQFLPVQLGVQVPPAIAPAFGEPRPVGPSQPAPALHRTVPQVPFCPVSTS